MGSRERPDHPKMHPPGPLSRGCYWSKLQRPISCPTACLWHTACVGVESLQQTEGPPHGPRSCLGTSAVLPCICPCSLEPAQSQRMLMSHQGLLTGLEHPIQAKFIFDVMHTEDEVLKMKLACVFFFFLFFFNYSWL